MNTGELPGSTTRLLRQQQGQFETVPAHAPGTLARGVHMPASNDALKDRLSRYREINLSVTGRKSGRTISQPVWFVLEIEKLYLLPVQGRSAFATRAFVTKREQKNKSAVLQAAITCLEDAR